MASTACASRVVSEESRRGRDKRFTHHHSQQHIRPQQKTVERQKRLREKRRTSNANFISTDGTTSGDDPEMQYSSEQEIQARLEQLLRKSDQLPSDLEADCEDNNSTDLDTISISGTVKHKADDKERSDAVTGEVRSTNQVHLSETDIQLLNAKIRNLEKQLETVLSLNVKLKEENEQLKRILPRQNP